MGESVYFLVDSLLDHFFPESIGALFGLLRGEKEICKSHTLNMHYHHLNGHVVTRLFLRTHSVVFLSFIH